MQRQDSNERKIKKQEMDKCQEICNVLKILLWVTIILLVLFIGVAFICPFATEILAERTIFVQNELT